MDVNQCPQCQRPMQNLGNLSNIVFSSLPPQWDDVYVCHACRVKKSIRVHSAAPRVVGLEFLRDYRDVTG